MEVTFNLPDEIVNDLQGGVDVSHQILEALVLERYLRQEISLGKLSELLGLSLSQAEFFLDQHNARLPYTSEMLEEDRRSMLTLLTKK